VGLLIAAIFAAAMSTVDSSVNSASTLILTDFYKRYIRPGADKKESMKVLRVSTFIWSVLGTAAALLMIDVGNILDVWWRLSGIFGGGMLGLFLLGYFAKRVRNVSAAAAVSLGILIIMWMTFSPGWDSVWASPFHSFMIPVIGTLTIFLVGLLLSRKSGRTQGSPLRDD
jgi:SSS family solute:Na+ symporter